MDEERLFELFAAALPQDEAIDRRKMFGLLCAFVNGNMFAGVHQEDIVVRLGPRELAELRGLPGARPFEAMGRIMREYACLPPSVVDEKEQLSKWLDEGFRFAGALPVKEPKPRRKKAV